MDIVVMYVLTADEKRDKAKVTTRASLSTRDWQTVREERYS